MTNDRIQELLTRYFNGNCTASEKRELALWIHSLGNEEEWENHLLKVWEQYHATEKPDQEHLAEMLKDILADQNENKAGIIAMPPPAARSGMMKWAVAAAVVIGGLILFSLIYLVPNPNKQQQIVRREQQKTNHILPGSNKAILTLANGRQIILDSVKNGSFNLSGNIQVVKVKSGLLSYSKSNISNPESKIAYNTISTPRGGQYQVILPDGSKIWLNAASSLRFPTAFTGGKREITVKGEIYAEVAKDEEQPFIVHILSPSGADMGTVKVLGTSFNINAYKTDNPAKTTLLNGAVMVTSPSPNGEGLGVRLKPGEQALSGEEGINVRTPANLNGIIAWKNGLFDFSGSDIREVMERVSRWYDVKVKYKNIPSVHFMGTISRGSDVQDVLKMLEMTGVVHFEITGKTITVTK